jgi:hypothetical protein
MKQPEYTEGTQALENFKQLASAILQAPVKKQKKRADEGCFPREAGMPILARSWRKGRIHTS